MAVAKKDYVPGTLALEAIDSYFDTVGRLTEATPPERKRLLAFLENDPQQPAPQPGAPAAAPAASPPAQQAPAAGGDSEEDGYDAGWHVAHRGGQAKEHPGKGPAWNKGYQDGLKDGGAASKLMSIPAAKQTAGRWSQGDDPGRTPEQGQQARSLAAQLYSGHHNDVFSQLSRTPVHRAAMELGGHSDYEEPFLDPVHDWMTRVRDDPKAGRTDLEHNIRNFLGQVPHDPNVPHKGIKNRLKNHLRTSAVMHTKSWATDRERAKARLPQVSGHAKEPGGVGALDTKSSPAPSGALGGVGDEHVQRLHTAMQTAVDRMPHPEGWQPGQRSAREFLKRHIMHGMDQTAALRDIGVDHTVGANRQWASDQAQRLMRDPELMKVARDVHGMRQGESVDPLTALIGGLLESSGQWAGDEVVRNLFISWLRRVAAK